MVDCCSQRKDVKPRLVKMPPWKKIEDVQESQDMQLQVSQSLNITFMHWNILANKLADAFPKVPQEFLAWDYRFNLIIQHIEHINPDCIGLSEVDLYPIYKDIAYAMQKLGYTDYFVEKSNGISGSAIFYKKDKFVCLEQNSFTFSSKDSQFYMYCRLAPKSSNSFLE